MVKNVIAHYLWAWNRPCFSVLFPLLSNKRCGAVNIEIYTYVHGINVIEAMLLIIIQCFQYTGKLVSITAVLSWPTDLCQLTISDVYELILSLWAWISLSESIKHRKQDSTISYASKHGWVWIACIYRCIIRCIALKNHLAATVKLVSR